jgi:hypothetical protein
VPNEHVCSFWAADSISNEPKTTQIDLSTSDLNGQVRNPVTSSDWIGSVTFWRISVIDTTFHGNLHTGFAESRSDL